MLLILSKLSLDFNSHSPTTLVAVTSVFVAATNILTSRPTTDKPLLKVSNAQRVFLRWSIAPLPQQKKHLFSEMLLSSEADSNIKPQGLLSPRECRCRRQAVRRYTTEVTAAKGEQCAKTTAEQ